MEAIELYDMREMIQKPSKTIDMSNYFEQSLRDRMVY